MDFLKNILKIDEINNISISGLTKQLNSFCINNIFENKNNDILVLVNSLFEANQYYSILSKINKNTFLFPMDDFLTSEAIAISPELKTIRINTLNSICLIKDKKIIITNLMGYLRYLPIKQNWIDSIINIKIGDEISKENLYKQLLEIGYISETVISKTGEVANRGYIIDVFSLNYDNPIRIEFWGDTIESIRMFDVDTQRSIKEIQEISISPYSEFYNEKGLIDIEYEQKYLPYVSEKVSSIKEYLDNPIIIYKDYKQLKNSYKLLREEIFKYNLEKCTKYDTNYMHNFEDLYQKSNNIYLLNIDNIIKEKNIKKNYVFDSKVPEKFESNYEVLNQYLENNLLKKKKILICINEEPKLKNIKKYLTVSITNTNFNNLYYDKVNLIKYDLDEGFIIDDFIVLTENEIYKTKSVNVNFKNNFKLGVKIKNLDNLKVGDYVVHLEHGIGIYSGIKTLTKNGNKKDYLEIKYSGDDKLYIPVEKIDLINKYSSKEGIVPKINKLGGVEWQKTKLRIKNKVKDIAERLIKISAERKLKKGFSFKKDDEEQLVFESEFKYTPTTDQLIAINKIKKDMESSYPMDMLLCGDVGYGKTEVAFRAIFKAINSGKQVAYLCPTTILSNQQYKNAIERFENYGINIALLNRFTSSKELKIILDKLKEGKIDLLFGTHKILGKDIKFKDLGLLIIDEEQRFGVTHKEKIKEYKSNIDVLTLSATPIPRTLQMSLVGIRNLALIETPPINRYPVQTYVIEENNQLIREAIYKEMSRGGQIFILFNRVDYIDQKLIEIKNLVPEANIRCAHGRMTKNQIEDTMNSFINNEFDILLCTTIIETGIDIPNVNTLIIYDADKFGLSQLYQLRGRVGRSNKIAYSYLMYKKNKVLNDIAIKRLNAIKEFTELGSGFQIAMRDLSIRGAGDILGTEQAGFIDSVGYNLYLKILNDEVNRLKGIKSKEESVDEDKPLIEVETHIKNEYVSQEELKIEIHKKINEIDSFEKLDEIKKEIEDRFGKIDKELNIYMYSELFEKQAKKFNIKKVNVTNLFVEIYIPKEILKNIEVDNLFYEASKISRNFKFNYKNEELSIKLMLNKLEKNYVYYLTNLLSKISIN